MKTFKLDRIFEPNIRQTAASRIRQGRAEQGLSYKDAADKFNELFDGSAMTRTNWCLIESGSRVASIILLGDMARAIGLTFSVDVGAQDQPTKAKRRLTTQAELRKMPKIEKAIRSQLDQFVAAGEHQRIFAIQRYCESLQRAKR